MVQSKRHRAASTTQPRKQPCTAEILPLRGLHAESSQGRRNVRVQVTASPQRFQSIRSDICPTVWCGVVDVRTILRDVMRRCEAQQVNANKVRARVDGRMRNMLRPQDLRAYDDDWDRGEYCTRLPSYARRGNMEGIHIELVVRAMARRSNNPDQQSTPSHPGQTPHNICSLTEIAQPSIICTRQYSAANPIHHYTRSETPLRPARCAAAAVETANRRSSP